MAAYAERRGLDPLRPDSAIVVRPEPAEPAQAPVLPPAPAPGHPESDGGSGMPEAPTPAPAVHEAVPELPRTVAADEQDLPELDADDLRGPTGVLTEAELAELRRILSGEDEAAPPAVPETTPAVHEVEADADPAPERPEPWRPPAPMLPGMPYQSVAAAEIAAVVEADSRVQVARRDLADYLELAYRDPAEAAQRLAALQQGPSGTAAVGSTLARKPEALGALRGSGWLLAGAESKTERCRALSAAGRIDDLLRKRNDAEWLAAGLYRNPIEVQRHLAVVEVPGLSPQALRAAKAVSAAGATVGWRDPAPWDDSWAPTADEIAQAARVAPVWAAIQARPGLHDELQRFMVAARQRLPNHHCEPRDDLDGPEQAVQALSGVLHAARALYLWHPRFQAYAAGEPERQAQAARERAERDAAAEQARRMAEEKVRVEEKAKAEIDARLAAALARRARPRPSSGPSMG